MDKKNRRPVVAGNWKMNLTRPEAAALVKEILPIAKDADCEVVLCVPFTDLETGGGLLAGANVLLGAQNCHWETSGAFTGEISAQMLAEMGVRYVIVGHSERRRYFGETDETVNGRLKAALAQGLRAIVCVGETFEQREAKMTAEVIRGQTAAAFSGIPGERLSDIVVAYEPVWAIGTGKTATAGRAGEVCALIRGQLAELYGQQAALGVRIQYGGSMHAKNAAELLDQPDIDGGLIGGASLKAAEFSAIILAASR
jgi:triosephosphate isomerase